MGDQKKFTEADCAYLAGLIDLKGRVSVQRQQRSGEIYRSLFLQFHDLPDSIVEWLDAHFGPAACFSKPKEGEITYVTRRAAELFVHAYPYLVEMKRVATLVTKFASSVGPNRSPLSSEGKAIRAEVDQELQVFERSRGGRR
jgi:hypothetical protein